MKEVSVRAACTWWCVSVRGDGTRRQSPVLCRSVAAIDSIIFAYIFNVIVMVLQSIVSETSGFQRRDRLQFLRWLLFSRTGDSFKRGHRGNACFSFSRKSVKTSDQVQSDELTWLLRLCFIILKHIKAQDRRSCCVTGSVPDEVYIRAAAIKQLADWLFWEQRNSFSHVLVAVVGLSLLNLKDLLHFVLYDEAN